MARIPGYESDQVSLRGAQAPLDLMSGKSEGRAQLGTTIVQGAAALGDTIRYVQQKRARVYANSSMAKLREHMSQQMIEFKKAAGPGAVGYTDNVLKTYDDFVKGALKDAPNDYAVQDLTELSESFRATVLEDATHFEAASTEAKTRFDVKDATMMAANSLATHPEWFEDIFADHLMAFKAITGGLTPQSEIEERFDMANSLAVAAINGEIRADPKIALQKLDSGYWDHYMWDGEPTTLITAEQKLAFTQAAKQALRTSNDVEQYMMRERIRHHLASVENTGVGGGVAADEVFRVFSNNGESPEKGEIARLEFLNGLGVARKVFSVREGLEFASLEDRANLLKRYEPKPGSPTFADDQAVYERLLAWNAQDMNLMVNDPAAWADKNGNVSDAMNEGGPLAAAEVALVRQEFAGVPAYKRRILTSQGAKEIVSQLKSSEPRNVLEMLSGFESSYGPRFGALMAELQDAGLSSDYMAVHSIAKFNPAVAHDFIQAMTMNEADLKKEFTEAKGMPWSTVDAQAEMVLDEFKRSQIRLSPERLPTIQTLQSLFARTAAVGYKSDPSVDIQTRMQMLYNHSIGGMLDVRDTYFIPRVSPNGTPIDTNRRAQELEMVIRDQEWIREKGFTNAQNIPPPVMARWLRWQTLEDGSGLRLVIERPNGVVPVTRSGPRGYRDEVTVSFDELARGPWREAPSPEERMRLMLERASRVK